MKTSNEKTAKRVYQAAIVGCGRMGCFLDEDPKRKGTLWTHAAAYKACPRTNLVALVDVDGAARARAGERWNVTNLYPSLEAMLRNTKVDILSICTRSDSHAALFREAVKARIPAIWCEKPMATRLQEAREMVHLSKKRIVAVNHSRRWDRPYEITRQWIKDGHVGKPIAITAYYTHGTANIGSHLFDILRFLLGEINSVTATGHNPNEPDPTLSGFVKFANGAVGHIVGCGGEQLLFEIDIIGNRGRVRISENGWKVEAWSLKASARYSGYQEYMGKKVLWEGTDKKRMLTALKDIVRSLDDHTSLRCNAVDGMKTVELVTAFCLAAKTGRRVDLPIKKSQSRMEIPVR